MATFDQLSAEQRAIIELVLKQKQSYDQLGDMLGMPTSRVRELARDALVRLSPVSAASVDDEWRGQLGDYLLNQQTGPESTATRGHLRHSEEARGWARSVLDSLEQFYTDGDIPQIPAGEAAPAPRRKRERKPKEPKPKRERAPKKPRQRRELSPAAAAAVRRRRILGVGALAVVAAVVVLALTDTGPLFSNDDKPSKASNTGAAAAPRIVGQLVLRPQGNQGRNTAGIAVIAERGGQRQLIVQAQLPANKDRQAYEVWLFNSPSDARSLGAQVTDRQGTFQGAGPLPKDFERYRFIDVSLEKVDQARGHSGNSILRGRIDQIQAPPQNAGAGQGDQTAPQQQPQQQPPPQQGTPPSP